MRLARPKKARLKKRVIPQPTAETQALSTSPILPAPPALIPAPQPAPQHPLENRKHLPADALIRAEDDIRTSIESFLMDQRSEHTRRAYHNDLKRFIKFLLLRRQAIHSLQIDRSTVVSFKEFLLGDGLQSASVDRHLATLRSFFSWLKEEGLVAENPAEKVRFLAMHKISPTKGFSDEEVIRVLHQPDLHQKTGTLHYAVLATLFYCGLRRSELCALRCGDLLSERGHYVLKVKGKGGRERLIPLVPRVWNAIQIYLRMNHRAWEWEDLLKIQEEPLFSAVRKLHIPSRPQSPGRHPLDPSLVFYIVKRYAKAAGVKSKVSPHSCRATAISNARDHLVPDRAIQQFAGWASTQMITRYDKRKTAIEESAAHAIQYEEEKK